MEIIRLNIQTPKSAPKPTIKKRHWCLGTMVVVLGSWITHTTTARIYQDFNSQQAWEFARAIPTSGTALNGRLPDPLFIPSLQTSGGPLSDSLLTAQSPSAHLFADPTPVRQELDEHALEEKPHTIKRGDTLGKIFQQFELGLALPHAIGQHPTAKHLINLTVGKKLHFGYNATGELAQIRYPTNALQEFIVKLEGEEIIATEVNDLPFQTVERAVSGQISTSLYQTAIDAGLSNRLVMEMVRIFGWDIDFVLDIRSGDTFHTIFEEFQLNGERLSDGDILVAEFSTQHQTYRAVRYTNSNGESSYYNPEGKSMLGTFLRSPVEFSRISSRFGKRKHPILKKWRAHKGVDYAAARGTPIRATADGKVIHTGKKGGYGKTVILRHAGRFSTLYAHMNGYAKGVRTGKRVKQGDIIGYIGSTGLATGPHLHYEFRLDGVHRNPLTFKTPKASAVDNAEMSTFQALANQQLARLDVISRRYQLAKITTSSTGE